MIMSGPNEQPENSGPDRIRGKMQPRGSLVLVSKHEKKEEVTTGGVLIPMKVSNEGITYATVVEIGPGRYLENGDRAAIDLQKGDTVMISSAKGMPLSVSDRKMFLINEADVLARIID